MLVARVIGDCPGCGGSQCYGNVSIGRDHIVRGCGRCDYRSLYPLPPLKPKKILYLDQNFFSAAFRNKIDPSKGQPEIVRVVRRIKGLAAAQMIAVPLSSVHERETRQWDLRKEALEFLKTTSRGHEFERDYKVERTQVLRAFSAWLNGKPPKYQIEPGDALTQRVHDWEDYFFVDVELDRGDGSEERSRKLGSVENLVNLFDGWRADHTSFEQDFRGELEAQVQLYRREHERWYLASASGDIEALLSTPLIERMRQLLQKRVSWEEGVRKCRDFLRSEHFANVPVHAITCRTHASLKQEVMRGAYAQRDRALSKLRGYYTDLDHIAHYAPYCDAIAVDKAMAELMKKPGVALADSYNLHVFSLGTIEAFDVWLDEIEYSQTEEHREALRAAYG